MEAQLKVADNGAWLAVGISKDDLMGNDTVFECHFLPKGKGSVHLSHNLKTTNLMLPEATQTLLRDSYTEERDGRVFCGAEWMLDFTVLDPSEKKMVEFLWC
ncbi:DOMON domain-containing protein [Trichostrongylus colubriformis]|uniref:DOMON domain-containing protein n=1 Tax=Trichostrongylus colubriformis TaxID=6319 RepID=A0AAN8EQY4_TRICO